MIPKVYYINLAHRTDRNEQFLGEMKKLECEAERIDGIYMKGRGALGCGLSHKKALETFYASGESYGIICEDDLQITLNIEYCKFLLALPFKQQIDFDVIMLAGNIMKQEKTSSPFLHKVFDGQTASAYLITRSFAVKLIQAFGEATKLLEEWYISHNERKHEYCIDIYWKQLQPQSNWFILNPKLGVQRESYSDNEEKITNYGV